MKKQKVKKENNERWLLTYSDLITLLMIFFVVMYTMSNVDKSKYQELAASLSGSFSGSPYVVGEEGGINPLTDITEQKPPSDTEDIMVHKAQQVKQQVEAYLQANHLNNKIEISIEPRGLVMSLKENAFFRSGEAAVLPAYSADILAISKILGSLGNDIVVEGHTDNQPIHNSTFHSNWELAAMRAINVVDLLIKEGGLLPEKLSIVSYGEYRPIASNDTEEGRAKNRRINIVVLSSDFYNQK